MPRGKKKTKTRKKRTVRAAAENNETAKPVKYTEKTKAQITTSFGRQLTLPLPASYSTYRTIRGQPTVSLARALVKAAILAGSWNVDQDDDIEEKHGNEIKDFIRDQFEPIREHIIETALDGGGDFGWAPFELVFDQDNGKTILGKAKALLQDLTVILVDVKTGAFEGFRQTPSGSNVDILDKYALNIPFRVEGSNWYGAGLLESIRETYNQWREAQAGAERYDAKVAGAHWVVYFPIGTSPDEDDEEKDNAEIAEDILDALESSGSVTVPVKVSAFAEKLSKDNMAWRIELLEDKGGRQPTFVDRLKYLDALLVRGWMMPERAILEGEFGTKAEAGVHGDVAVMNVTLWDRQIATAVNRGPVDTLLEQNWGAELRGKVYLVPAPLVDAQLAFLRDLYKLIMTNAATVLDEMPTINTDQLKEHLGVPKSEETAQAGETPEKGLSLEERTKLASRMPTVGEDSILKKIAKKLGWFSREEE